LDRNNGNGDDMKVEGAMMAMRLLRNFGRYGIQPFCISYETGNDDDDDDDDNDDNDNDNDDAEEADGVPMTRCVAYHTLTGATLTAN
jgi:hypothetical protein